MKQRWSDFIPIDQCMINWYKTQFSDPSYFYPEKELNRIKIFMLKFACGQNFVLFGHSGHELQRFENLVLVNL